MAIFEDVFRGGNIVTGLAIGVGFALLAPVVKPFVRPLAKTAIKAGLAAYDQGRVAVAELTEHAGDSLLTAFTSSQLHLPIAGTWSIAAQSSPADRAPQRWSRRARKLKREGCSGSLRRVNRPRPHLSATQQARHSLGAASLLLFAIGRLQGLSALHMLRSAVALAVASVPEGLPMVATTTHTIGVNALRQKDIIVRRLDALETMAAVNVVCFDKTGTLTENRMSVAQIDSGERSHLTIDEVINGPIEGPVRALLEIGCLCSEVELGTSGEEATPQGSSTEVALVRSALKNGVDVEELYRVKPRLSLQLRTETYRFMVTTHEDEGQVLIAMKGNPADVLERCQYEATVTDRCKPLTKERRSAIERKHAAMASKGLRVLGFSHAYGQRGGVLATAEHNMVWLGAVGLRDPIRPSVRPLVRHLHRAGVRTIMLTGDQRKTAEAVGQGDQTGRRRTSAGAGGT